MKMVRYLLLVVFTLAYAVGIAIDISMLLFGGLGGTYPYIWVIPLHFIFGTVFFVLYIISIRPEVTHPVFKASVSSILLILILPLPILFVMRIQYQSDKAHSDYEQTCRIVELESYKYKFCTGKPGTYGPGAGPIGIEVGDPAYGRAMKVWDAKGWKLYKSETEWYYK